MPSGDSKIKFTVEGITQLHQSFQSILNDSKALTEEWARQGTSIVKSLQEQIDLLKKRNSYGVPPSLVGGGSQQIKAESSADIEQALESIVQDGVLIHKDSLKELANLIKTSQPTAKPVSGGTVPGTAPSEGSGPQQEKEREEADTARFLRNFALSGLLRPLQSSDPLQSGISGAQNIGSSLMALGGKAGLVGLGVGALAGILGAKYSTVAQVASTAAQAARLLGGDWASYVPAGNETQYGLHRNEVLQRQMELAKAMGRQDLGTNFDQALLWESSTMLTSSDIAAFARSGRGDRNFSISSNLTSLFETLKKSGVSNEKIQTQMAEYLREIVSLNTMQLDQFGKSDSGLNTAIYSMIAKVLPQTAEANPALIGRLASGFYSGMSSASSRQIEALQYSVAARHLAPGETWYQARMMREDPFGLSEGLTPDQIRRRNEYTQDLMKSFRSAAGSTDSFALLLEKQFGLKANQAYAFARQYETGGFDLEQFRREAEKAKQETEAEQELRRKLPEVVDAISRMDAEWESTKMGKSVEGIREAAEGIFRLLGGEAPPTAAQVVDKEQQKSMSAGLYFLSKTRLR